MKMMFSVMSGYYERRLTFSPEEAETILKIYHDVAREHHFSPETSDIQELENPSVLDHVLYHVDHFGGNKLGFKYIRHIWEDEL